MTRRFYVEPSVLVSDRILLPGDLARRLTKVLRLRVGDEVMLFDGSGTDARVRIDDVAPRAAWATVLERTASPAEPCVRVHLHQSIVKGERFEWLVEKVTEIGVARIVPLLASRAVVTTASDAQRAARWRRIAVSAAEQSGRGSVPPVEAPQPLVVSLERAPGLLLLPDAGAGHDAPGIGAALAAQPQPLLDVSVIVGPEGGFEPAEVALARDAGAVVVTLGRRILRAETAGLLATALVLYHAGELGEARPLPPPG